MAKKTYAVEFGGQVFTRKTERTYTHVVIVRYPFGWEAAHWCGNLRLAGIQASKYTGEYVRILEIPEPKKTNKYTVQIHASKWFEITVDAENYDQAMDIALAKANKQKLTPGDWCVQKVTKE